MGPLASVLEKPVVLFLLGVVAYYEVVGFFYQARLYSELGINIFQFMELTDLIFIGWKDLSLFFIAAIGYSLGWGYVWFKDYDLDTISTLPILVFILVLSLWIGATAAGNAQAFTIGDGGTWATVDDPPKSVITLVRGDSIDNLLFVGATAEYFFFYSRERNALEIIGKEEVERIQSVATLDRQPEPQSGQPEATDEEESDPISNFEFSAP